MDSKGLGFVSFSRVGLKIIPTGVEFDLTYISKNNVQLVRGNNRKYMLFKKSYILSHYPSVDEGLFQRPSIDYGPSFNESNYNFDITADWEMTMDDKGKSLPVTDKESFEGWLGYSTPLSMRTDVSTGVIVEDFLLVENRLRCNLVVV